MFDFLRPFFTWRFIKFCVVGTSGVFVNFAGLALLARVFGWNANWAAALAILLSINTNFIINELWTFKDRRFVDSKLFSRWAKFHLVSIVGGAAQWIVFVFMNLAIAMVINVNLEASTTGILGPFLNPPTVGNWIFLSQLVGIGVATMWNFMANFYWTWRHREQEIENG